MLRWEGGENERSWTPSFTVDLHSARLNTAICLGPQALNGPDMIFVSVLPLQLAKEPGKTLDWTGTALLVAGLNCGSPPSP